MRQLSTRGLPPVDLRTAARLPPHPDGSTRWPAGSHGSAAQGDSVPPCQPRRPMTAVRTESHAEHPVVTKARTKRAENLQLRIADAITSFAGSMPFVYVHI